MVASGFALPAFSRRYRTSGPICDLHFPSLLGSIPGLPPVGLRRFASASANNQTSARAPGKAPDVLRTEKKNRRQKGDS
jgi:hypothetical protein